MNQPTNPIQPVVSSISIEQTGKPSRGKWPVAVKQYRSEAANPVVLYADRVDPNDSASIKAFITKARKKCPALNANDIHRDILQLLASPNSARNNREPEVETPQVGEDGLRNIRVGNRPMRHLARDACRELDIYNKPPQVFLRQGKLVRVVEQLGKDRRRHVIDLMDETTMRGQVARAANFINNRGVQVDPPVNVVRDVLQMGEWKPPTIEAIVETPVLRPDGSILQNKGYDATTGLYYVPAPGLVVPAIPESPSQDDVASALACLNEPFAEFPFDSAASRANFYALLVTLMVRQAVDGCAPMCAVDATTPGTGKGLLIDAAHVIATGQHAPAGVASNREAEFEKRITADLLGGNTFVLLDNIEEPLASASLAAVLTAPVWAGRILGYSEKVHLPNRTTWVATGNNLLLAGDLPRRAYWVRLCCGMSNPELRTFNIPNLIPWVIENRGRLLAALLTICRAWYADGRPDADHPVLGRFESWCNVVGGILSHAGVEGFLADVQHRPPRDEAAEAWVWFLECWERQFNGAAVTVSEIVSRLRRCDDFKHSLPADLAGRISDGWDAFPHVLGIELRKKMGRPFGPNAICVKRADSDRHAKVGRWQVVSAGTCGDLRGPAQSSHIRDDTSYADDHNHNVEEQEGDNVPHFPAGPCHQRVVA